MACSIVHKSVDNPVEKPVYKVFFFPAERFSTAFQNDIHRKNQLYQQK